MSLAYKNVLAECEREGVEPPTVDEFLKVDCSVMPSMTVQSEKDNCDINRIVAQFDRTGLLTHVNRGVPQFADISDMNDFGMVAERIAATHRWFMGLPAPIRAEFQNDPGVLLDAIADPRNEARMQELGFLEKPGVEKPAEGAPPA